MSNPPNRQNEARHGEHDDELNGRRRYSEIVPSTGDEARRGPPSSDRSPLEPSEGAVEVAEPQRRLSRDEEQAVLRGESPRSSALPPELDPSTTPFSERSGGREDGGERRRGSAAGVDHGSAGSQSESASAGTTSVKEIGVEEGEDLERRTHRELYNRAKALGVDGRSRMNKRQLVEAIRKAS